jgi:hypothetical protein
MASASKVPTAVSKVSVIAASGRRALLTPNSPSFLSLRFNPLTGKECAKLAASA